jgi:hypothetical protein
MPRETGRAEDLSCQQWRIDLPRGIASAASDQPGSRSVKDLRASPSPPAEETIRGDRSVEIRSGGTIGKSYFTVAPTAAPLADAEARGEQCANPSGEGIGESVVSPARKGRAGAPGLRRGPRLPRGGRAGHVTTDVAPPTPWGCQWRKTDNGWSLWRCWSERESSSSPRVHRSRYAGFLSNDGWEVLKGYDYETFLAILGQRLRRYGKR